MKNKNHSNKKGQLTVFIILAILIVIVIILFFIFKGNIFSNPIPKTIDPAYSYYISCINDATRNGAALLGTGAGHIKEVQFSAGSEYMPFSSHLGFMGNAIPYWYYISGNGLSHENVPTIEKMQSELNDYIIEQINKCDFSDYQKIGYEINLSSATVSTSIKSNDIVVNVNQKLKIKYGDTTWSSSKHSSDIKSNLGKFYEIAYKIYSYEKQSLFLEKYAVDIIRLYAPVDGSDISCTPKIWQVNQIRKNISDALEANTAMIKVKGSYYTLNNNDNKYFVKDIGEDVPYNVNFMYSRYWPTRMQVWPSEDGLLRADPVGLQEGLGMLGFCYVPYHFVYDLGYPVLIQIYYNDELFEFPFAVVVDKNKPKDSGNLTISPPNIVPELCLHPITPISVYTYNTNLEPVSAKIKFNCFDNTCDIGYTNISGADSSLNANFPQCANGFIVASADGYETNNYMMSTIVSGSIANILMKKKYKINLNLTKAGQDIDGYSVITFVKDNKTTTVAYPEQRQIELTEGQYLVTVYIYSNASIQLKGSTNRKCIQVPSSGILGAFGSTEEKCFNMEIPDQTVEFAVSGGGTYNYYLPESELYNGRTMNIDAENFGVPTKVQEIQQNYNNIATSSLNINLEDDNKSQ